MGATAEVTVKTTSTKKVKPVAKAKVKAAKAKNIRPCIATKCRKASKGPRFHYLCEEHRGAPAKQVKAWQDAKKAK